MNMMGKEISKKLILLIIVGGFCIGLASAAVVTFISNSMSATVNVETPLLITGQLGLVDPATYVGVQPVLPLTDTYQGGVALATMRVQNLANSEVMTGLYASVQYNNIYAIPLASDDITGAEFDVIGGRSWHNTWLKWDPEVSVCQAHINSNTGNPMLVGEWDNDYYYFNDGTADYCFWNYADEIQAAISGGFIPAANPLVVDTSALGLTFPVPAGLSEYRQIAIKTHLGGGTAIAPGDYVLSAQAVP